MIHDLTTILNPSTPVFPYVDEPPLDWKHIQDIIKDRIQVSLVSMSTHLGTHVDVPLHYIANTKDTSQVDLSRYCGQACCIEIENFPSEGMFDIEPWLIKNKELIKKADILLLYTGWEAKLGTREYFDFPTFLPNLGELMESYGLVGLGFDMPSLDLLPAMAHIGVLSREYGIIEQLVNLKPLVGRNFFFSAVPLKFEDGDGSPVRAYAITDD